MNTTGLTLPEVSDRAWVYAIARADSEGGALAVQVFCGERECGMFAGWVYDTSQGLLYTCDVPLREGHTDRRSFTTMKHVMQSTPRQHPWPHERWRILLDWPHDWLSDAPGFNPDSVAAYCPTHLQRELPLSRLIEAGRLYRKSGSWVPIKA